jgi:YD repeat-containing protein
MMDTFSGTTQRSVTYNLDKAGNRTSIVDNGATKNYTPNNLNQYTAAQGSTVTNGSEHELVSYQGVSYTYINDERLKTVTAGSNSYQLAYDAVGRCVKRTLNSDSSREQAEWRPIIFTMGKGRSWNTTQVERLLGAIFMARR